MRLFIAIMLNDDLKEELMYNIDDLKEYAEKGSFTKEENFHLTLAFLDEVDKKDIPLVKECMVKAVMNFETDPVYLSLGGYGYFKRKGKPEKTFYRQAVSSKGTSIEKNRNGVKKSVEKDRINELCENVRRELSYAGIYYDEKPFKPHITLARGLKLFSDFDEEWFEDGLLDASMKVDRISLVESVRHGADIMYNSIFDMKL